MTNQLIIAKCGLLVAFFASDLSGQGFTQSTTDYMSISQATADPALDPKMTVGYQSCLKCHASEAMVWKTTWHHTSYDDLHRRPIAKRIASRLNLTSIRNQKRCIACHYTPTLQNGEISVDTAVSCECCHGAGNLWVHNHFPPKTSIENETAEQKASRVARNLGNGMRNRHNTYSMARICMRCHNVADEELVNVGGHSMGDPTFEMVSWSQGRMRHRFISGNGSTNAPNSPERLAMIFVSGIIADLEFSLRATGQATTAGDFGKGAARRASTAAKRLSSVYKKVQLPILRQILVAYDSAELKANNQAKLTAAAEQIRKLGIKFAAEHSGGELSAIQAYVPGKDRWLFDR